MQGMKESSHLQWAGPQVKNNMLLPHGTKGRTWGHDQFYSWATT